MNSWDRSDSGYDADGRFIIGENDLALAGKLCRAGSDHRKFLRQILISADIEAPLYWWKEYDTYKVATVSNSTSTMHKIHSRPFKPSQFSCELMTGETRAFFVTVIERLEALRQEYLATGDKRYWYDIIQLLPSSYHQLRTCTLNYETAANIYRSRRNHKLEEWHAFCGWLESLPYTAQLIVMRD